MANITDKLFRLYPAQLIKLCTVSSVRGEGVPLTARGVAAWEGERLRGEGWAGSGGRAGDSVVEHETLRSLRSESVEHRVGVSPHPGPG